MDRIRYLSPDRGQLKAIVYLAPERAMVFELQDPEPPADGIWSILISDPSRSFWNGMLRVKSRMPMGALQRAAEAAVKAWDQLGGTA